MRRSPRGFSGEVIDQHLQISYDLRAKSLGEARHGGALRVGFRFWSLLRQHKFPEHASLAKKNICPSSSTPPRRHHRYCDSQKHVHTFRNETPWKGSSGRGFAWAYFQMKFSHCFDLKHKKYKYKKSSPVQHQQPSLCQVIHSALHNHLKSVANRKMFRMRVFFCVAVFPTAVLST